jgi:hypothetical protein
MRAKKKKLDIESLKRDLRRLFDRHVGESKAIKQADLWRFVQALGYPIQRAELRSVLDDMLLEGYPIAARTFIGYWKMAGEAERERMLAAYRTRLDLILTREAATAGLVFA